MTNVIMKASRQINISRLFHKNEFRLYKKRLEDILLPALFRSGI
ncbi:hypothetical protein DOT_5072 [Desulfosporosinus sp. OT]|nr:hypothetical protein DOT_5072 [Desulfosporosinus sp. OT]